MLMLVEKLFSLPWKSRNVVTLDRFPNALRAAAITSDAGIAVSFPGYPFSRGWTKNPTRDFLWFTEGFDTKDLQEAKALLEELNH
jgi:hypothetical protein